MTDMIPLPIMYLFYLSAFRLIPVLFTSRLPSSLAPSRRSYVHVVEACFIMTQRKVDSFILPGRTAALRSAADICRPMPQCDDDYRLLNQRVSDTAEALGKKTRITTWFRAKESNLAPPQ